MSKSWKTGGCHCGAVAYKALTDDIVTVEACNCSICNMVGFHHLIIAARDFELLSGHDDLTEYSYNTGIAKHYFCRKCGVKSYYVPRSNPDGISLNIRCMDEKQFEKITVQAFDGQNWEANAARLAHLSD